jgi:hypothetical protein
MGIFNPYFITIATLPDNSEHLYIKTFTSVTPFSDYLVENFVMDFNSDGTLNNISGSFMAYV